MATSFGNTEDLPPPFGHLDLEEFNSTTLVESADTAPFFHNHTVPDLESAIAFYGTPAFKNSFFTGVIEVDISPDPNDGEVQAMAAFLRVLNALENIRSSINVAERGRAMIGASDKRDLARLSLSEVIDAMQVLSKGSLAKQHEPDLLAARVKLLVARVALESARLLTAPKAIDALLQVATASLRSARSELAATKTLPASFRN